MHSKVIVISGGSDGVGKEIAKLLQPNHQVVITSSTEKVEQTAKELTTDFMRCDVTSFTQCQQVIDYTVKKYGRVDVVISELGIKRVNH
jgi:3-oxoacyl-[acyl-carrier protein] reductase